MSRSKRRQIWIVKWDGRILGYIDAVSRSDAKKAAHGWFGYSRQGIWSLAVVPAHGKISELTPILITKKRKAEIRAENERRFGVGWDVVDLGVKP